jgi:phosphomannomutase / phosphoglucomutase
MTAQKEIAAEIFRAYDIRGIVGQGLDEDSVYWIGRAIGSEALSLGEHDIAFAADARLSSPALSAALIKGLLATGCHVIDLGVVPTPLLYFATQTLPNGSGVMLTGSHNPRDYNGIKIVLNQQTLADNQITRLRERIVSNDLATGAGKLTQHDILPDYLRAITERICLRSNFRVLIDCGSGVTALVAPQLFRALGCSVELIAGEVDGNFPLHHPDPTRVENLAWLIEKLGEDNFDLGIAFDGDGDRVILVTGDGNVIDADHMLLAFAMDILLDEPGASVVFDVKSSHHLPRIISACGGSPVMCKSGHSFVKRQVLESDAVLGGEFSAHIFFRHRWFGFDDGMYVAARFLELMDKYGASAQAILDKSPHSFSTPELFVPVLEDDKFALMARLIQGLRLPGACLNYLDGIRADFDLGWGLVRASNTTPNLVLRFEADEAAALEEIKAQFKAGLLKLEPTLELPF